MGAARSYQDLKQSVVSPSADVPDEMQGVSVTTAEATEYTGLRVNEDTFTIQVRLPDQSFRSFQKQHLKRFTYEKNSLMPAYHLAQSDLDNLLAFLSSLRGLVNNTADTRKHRGFVELGALLLAAAFALPVCGSDVTFDRLVHASDYPKEWLSYWGDYSATRFRTLNQINDRNVQKLRVEWIYQTSVQGAFETVPLVVDGVMYFTSGGANAYAIDAASGRELWHYQYRVPEKARPCCGSQNRGLALLGNKLFMATPDARIVAIDRRNGQLLWNSEIIPAQSIYGASLPL